MPSSTKGKTPHTTLSSKNLSSKWGEEIMKRYKYKYKVKLYIETKSNRGVYRNFKKKSKRPHATWRWCRGYCLGNGQGPSSWGLDKLTPCWSLLPGLRNQTLSSIHFFLLEQCHHTKITRLTNNQNARSCLVNEKYICSLDKTSVEGGLRGTLKYNQKAT